MSEDVNGRRVFDVSIIGAGPVGLYAAYYAGLRMLSVVIFDALPQVGGQLAALYPKKWIYDVPGFPRVLAEHLVANLRRQALQYEPTVNVSERVMNLTREPDGSWRLETSKGRSWLARTVLVAAGPGAFVPRKLDELITGRMEGLGLHYVVLDLNDFKGKRVLVIGGGDTALDWANTLVGDAAKLTLIHKLARFQAHEDSVQSLIESRATVLVHHELQKIHGEEHVAGATIVDNRTGRTTFVEVDEILCCIGFITNLGPIQNWGLEIVSNSIAIRRNMQTNLPGVYAAGDIAQHVGKLKLIATGFGDAAMAVNHIVHVLRPEGKTFDLAQQT